MIIGVKECKNLYINQLKMTQKLFFFLALMGLPVSLWGQSDSLFLENLMKASGQRFSYVLQNPEKYEVQII